MNPTEEKEDVKSNKLSRIYKTDSFGFPINSSDENLYNRSKENKKDESAITDTDLSVSDLCTESGG